MSSTRIGFDKQTKRFIERKTGYDFSTGLEDFAYEFELFFQQIIIARNSWEVMIENFWQIPIEVFGRLRENLLARGVRVLGSVGPHQIDVEDGRIFNVLDGSAITLPDFRIVDFSDGKVVLSQDKFVGGPWQDEPIDKYAWFAERAMYAHDSGDGHFDVYTTMTRTYFSEPSPGVKEVRRGEYVVIFAGQVHDPTKVRAMDDGPGDLTRVRDRDKLLKHYTDLVGKNGARLKAIVDGYETRRQFLSCEAGLVGDLFDSAFTGNLPNQSVHRPIKIGPRQLGQQILRESAK